MTARGSNDTATTGQITQKAVTVEMSHTATHLNTGGHRLTVIIAHSIKRKTIMKYTIELGSNVQYVPDQFVEASFREPELAEEQPVAHRPSLQDRAARVIDLVTEMERVKTELRSLNVEHGGESNLSFLIRRAKEFEEKLGVAIAELHIERTRRKKFESLAKALEKELAAAPHWVPVDKASRSVGTKPVIVISQTGVEYITTAFISNGEWHTHVIPGDVLYVLEDLHWPGPSDIERAIAKNCKACRGTGSVDSGREPCCTEQIDCPSCGGSGLSLDAMRERLRQPFFGREAEAFGAKTYQLLEGERWECRLENQVESHWVPFLFGAKPGWVGVVQYRLCCTD